MKIKICGITNLADARCAFDAGADLLGFIFYDRSPRYIHPEEVKEIMKFLPPEVITVGVFVNETNARMKEIYRFCGLHILQLHGSESHEQLSQLKPIKIIKAHSLKNNISINELKKFSRHTLLLDTPSENFGGTGKTSNWELARRISKSLPIILAGGLTPANVGVAIEEVQPYGVDVSSGVEKEKGKKDHHKVQKFIENARKTSENLTM